MLMHHFNTNHGIITVKQTRSAYATKKWGGNHYAFRFQFEFGGRTSKNFTFYDSEYNFSRGKTTFTRTVALAALDSVLEDATTAINVSTVEDMMSEFGYESYREASRVFKGVNEELDKVREVITDDDTIFDLCNTVMGMDPADTENIATEMA